MKEPYEVAHEKVNKEVMLGINNFGRPMYLKVYNSMDRSISLQLSRILRSYEVAAWDVKMPIITALIK